MTRLSAAIWDKALSDSDKETKFLGNPVISAVAFGAAIRNTGGASINLKTNEFLKKNEPVYMVGGEEGVAPAELPPFAGSTEPPLSDIVNQLYRVKTSVGNSGEVYLGAWNNEKGNIVFDASRKYEDRGQAMGVARTRREDAIYDVKNERDIPVDYSKDS
jgi:hypothetical protein